MILYFSSTGNCRFVAQQLARELRDQACSILDLREVHLPPGEKLGFVFPTYFWRLPSVVDRYMKDLTIIIQDPEPYIFFVATYGSTCGQTGTFMRSHLRSKGLKLSARFSIKMADDWTVWYDLSDPAILEPIFAQEDAQIQKILKHIQAGDQGNYMRSTLPMLAVLGSGFFYDLARRTKHLHVEGDCIGCGLCVRECPEQAIRLQNGRPVWVKKQCSMCLHCLHACPQFAIQYKDKTRNNGQYRHP